MEITKIIKILAGLIGVLFLGYCIYFDRKRRIDPEYKKKVHNRRNYDRYHRQNATRISKIPNFSDPESIEKYFLQEIQLGESLIISGNFEGAIEHLANAIFVCGQSQGVLQVLKTSLPPQVYSMLMDKIQEYGDIPEGQQVFAKRSSSSSCGRIGGGIGGNHCKCGNEFE